jgi:hypothetical protein
MHPLLYVHPSDRWRQIGELDRLVGKAVLQFGQVIPEVLGIRPRRCIRSEVRRYS